LYHRFGSLDGLLFGVAQAGFRELSAHLSERAQRGATAPDIAAEFVEFCLARPALYGLMFERHYDWAALRAHGTLDVKQPDLALWRALIAELTARGAGEPMEDARLFLAGLHGLISLSLSGRANVGDLGRSDRDVALGAARRLARLLFPEGRAKRRASGASVPAPAAKRRTQTQRAAGGLKRPSR
jgi:AcrR family transcriptional regulator